MSMCFLLPPSALLSCVHKCGAIAGVLVGLHLAGGRTYVNVNASALSPGTRQALETGKAYDPFAACTALDTIASSGLQW